MGKYSGAPGDGPAGNERPFARRGGRAATSRAVWLRADRHGGDAQLRRWLAEVDCRESRRAGRARRSCPTFHVNTATTASVREALVRKVSHDTTLYADESSLCAASGKEYVGHRTVKHTAREYARRAGDVVVHTNTIENVFCIFKRGMTGVYQHCGEAHLHRYLAEFDFRHNRRAVPKNSDVERTNELLAMIDGKRLTYRRIGEAGHAEAEGVSFPPLQRRRKGK